MNSPGPSSAALVTGGTRGIGRAVAQRLAAAGTQTIILNHLQDVAEAARTQGLLEALGARVLIIRANLAYPDEIDRMFAQIRAQVDHLDHLVHCAALGAFKPLLATKPNQWDLTTNISARAFLACTQHAAPLMSGGSIVALSSLGSVRVVPNYGAMGPSKAALEAVVRYLAVELAPARIRVNAVAAGFIPTDSIKKFPDADKLVQAAIARTPAGRLGTPEEVADVVMFLLGPAARWICGQTIVADGGFSLS